MIAPETKPLDYFDGVETGTRKAEAAHKEFRAKARLVAEFVANYFGENYNYWGTVAIAKEIIAETEKDS